MGDRLKQEREQAIQRKCYACDEWGSKFFVNDRENPYENDPDKPFAWFRGRQVGGPLLKRLLSRTAGLSLYWLARIGVRDATNSFKGYSTDFVREVGIDSHAGFEIGIELTAKAKRLRRPVAEIPTIWLDRQLGESSFQLAQWIPHYLRWWRFAFGPRLDVATLRTRTSGRTSP